MLGSVLCINAVQSHTVMQYRHMLYMLQYSHMQHGTVMQYSVLRLLSSGMLYSDAVQPLAVQYCR